MSTIENIRDRFKNSINYSIRHDEESLIKQNEEMKAMLEKIVRVTEDFNPYK